jgi:hypothetical protein
MELCSRSVRTLGEQALGIKKGLFLNGGRTFMPSSFTRALDEGWL